MRPWVWRPACVGSDSSRVFSGSLAVTSSKPEIVMKRRPGLVGLNFLTGIFLYAPEEPFDFLAGPERDDCFLPVRGATGGSNAPLGAALLAAHRHGVDVADLDRLRNVLLLKCLLDLRLRRSL